MGVINVLAVFQILAVPRDVAKVAVKKSDAAVAHVRKFRSQTGIVAVHRVFGVKTVEHIHGVLLIIDIKRVEAVLRVKNMISRDVFIIEPVHGNMRKGFGELAKFHGRITEGRMRFFEEFYFLKVLVFGIRLIKNVKLFVAQINGAEAVLAAFAVVAPVAVAGVEAVAAKVAVVTVVTVHALVAELAFFYKGVIYAVPTEADPDAIRAVFGLHMTHNAVTVSAGRVVW